MKNYNNKDPFKFDYSLTQGVFPAIMFTLLLVFLWVFIPFSLFNYLFIQNSFWALLIIGFSSNILYISGYFETGNEIDFYERKYRKYYSHGICRFGKWKPLETPDYFLLKKDTSYKNWWRTHSGFRKRGPSIFFDADIYFYYQLFLITKGENDHIVYVTIERDENLIQAQFFANYLDIPIYERTQDGDQLVYKPTALSQLDMFNMLKKK